MSQQTNFLNPPIKNQKTVSLKRSYSAGPGIDPGMSNEEKEYKIKKIEAYFINIIKENEYTADKATIEETNGKEFNFFYFIGRLNPPHNGHIAALQKLVEQAKSTGSTALILLGSGPKQSDGNKRTMDNPIPFITKKDFVESKLEGVNDKDYIIREMTNPTKDISDYISEQLAKSSNLPNLTDIKITHIAGGKDEDASKLSFALKSAVTTATRLAPSSATVIGTVATIEPENTDTGSAMSATQVRKDAYKTVLNGNGFEEWNIKYGVFYGLMAETIYKEILYPITNYGLTKEQIQTYIDTGELPKKKNSKSQKAGTTKRRSNKYKNTKKYKKRKRKTHRRIH
jgi:nicotinamide mononucleotide adenylyltransferase